MAYATIEDIQNRMTRDLSEREVTTATNLLDDAAVIIDAYNEKAPESAKKLVSVRVVIRALGDGMSDVPIGASQASQSGLGYSQSWTYGSGASGEIYLAKLDKKILGVSNSIGSYSPVEELVFPKKEEYDEQNEDVPAIGPEETEVNEGD